jgi:uncharacterized protein YndB with AHSA1/START domain
MTGTALQPIQAEIDIAAPIDHVWMILTTPEYVAEWLGCMNFAAHIGHTFYMQPDPAKRQAGDIGGATWCDVEKLEEPGLLAFSWYMPDSPKTSVEFRLAQTGAGTTRVTLVHAGWEQFPPEFVASIHQALSGGWSGHVLPNLLRVCEA